MVWGWCGRPGMHDRHDLSDEEWARLEPFLPDRTPRRGGQWIDHRMVIDGVLWRTRAGAPWRDLPESYGNWKTVYNRHRRWSADGTWVLVLDFPGGGRPPVSAAPDSGALLAGGLGNGGLDPAPAQGVPDPA